MKTGNIPRNTFFFFFAPLSLQNFQAAWRRAEDQTRKMRPETLRKFWAAFAPL